MELSRDRDGYCLLYGEPVRRFPLEFIHGDHLGRLRVGDEVTMTEATRLAEINHKIWTMKRGDASFGGSGADVSLAKKIAGLIEKRRERTAAFQQLATDARNGLPETEKRRRLRALDETGVIDLGDAVDELCAVVDGIRRGDKKCHF